MTGKLVVLSTVGTVEDADRIARMLVEGGLAACVNVVPGVRSIYRWKGRVESDEELLLVMKTTAERFAALEAALLQAHPYSLPEVVALRVERGHAAYLEWLEQSVSGS
jgi:periplasmic divalent cation tolerance protein